MQSDVHITCQFSCLMKSKPCRCSLPLYFHLQEQGMSNTARVINNQAYFLDLIRKKRNFKSRQVALHQKSHSNGFPKCPLNQSRVKSFLNLDPEPAEQSNIFLQLPSLKHRAIPVIKKKAFQDQRESPCHRKKSSAMSFAQILV